jgi:hypothetical protein
MRLSASTHSLLEADRGEANSRIKQKPSSMSELRGASQGSRWSSTSGTKKTANRLIISAETADRPSEFVISIKLYRFAPWLLVTIIDDLACSFRARSASASMITADFKKQELVPCTYVWQANAASHWYTSAIYLHPPCTHVFSSGSRWSGSRTAWQSLDQMTGVDPADFQPSRGYMVAGLLTTPEIY